MSREDFTNLPAHRRDVPNGVQNAENNNAIFEPKQDGPENGTHYAGDETNQKSSEASAPA